MGMVSVQAEYRAYVAVSGGTVKRGRVGESRSFGENDRGGISGRVGEKGGRRYEDFEQSGNLGKGGNRVAVSKQDSMVKPQVGAVYERNAAEQQTNSVVAYDRSGKKTIAGNNFGARNAIKNAVENTAKAIADNTKIVSNQKVATTKSDYGEAVFVKTDPVSSETESNRIGAVNASQDYGKVIGAPQLSEGGLNYYNELKEKYGNMDFVLVSKDMIDVAKSQLTSYGNPNKMVVLIDEEKVERMATDKDYRKHYELIIAQAQNGAFLQRAVASSPSTKKAGINVLDNGAGSFMAACAKSTKEMNKKLEQKRAAAKAKKKETAKKDAKKKAEKVAEEKRKSKRIEEKKNKEIVENRGGDIQEHRDDTKRSERDGVSERSDLDKILRKPISRGTASLRYNVTKGNDTDSFKP